MIVELDIHAGNMDEVDSRNDHFILNDFCSFADNMVFGFSICVHQIKMRLGYACRDRGWVTLTYGDCVPRTARF